MNRHGISLIETLIFGLIAAFALMAVAAFLAKPAQMQRLLASSEVPREATRAMERLTNDLREAVPDSVQFDASCSSSPFAFAKPLVKQDYDTGPLTVEAVPVAYGYQGPLQGPGILMRVEGSTATPTDESEASPVVETPLLSPIDAPTEQAPMFQYDPQLQIVTIDVRYHPPGKPPIRLVRRVALSK